MNANYFWAYRELTDRLEKQSAEPSPLARISDIYKNREPDKVIPLPEWGTVFLFDPDARARLDEKIHKWYFPAVLEGLRGSGIRVYDRRKVLSQIYDKRDCIATRSLIFLLAEPSRPAGGPGSPPWYVRGCLDCSLEMSMVHFDLSLELPLSVNLNSILELMADDRMGGIGPTLSFDHSIPGELEYSLSFSWGRGVPFEMERLITESVRKHVQIIEAVKRLETQWDSRELFADLSSKIIAMYGDDFD
jgi:hypothetical protein